MRAAPRPANISTNEDADCAKNLASASLADRLGEQRLARAGRAVQQDALRHLGPELAEALRVAEELDDLAQLVLGLVGAGDVLPAHGARRARLDLLRLRARQVAQGHQEHDCDQAHEDDRQPEDGPVLDLVPGRVGPTPPRRPPAGPGSPRCRRRSRRCRSPRRPSSPPGGRPRARRIASNSSTASSQLICELSRIVSRCGPRSM